MKDFRMQYVSVVGTAISHQRNDGVTLHEDEKSSLVFQDFDYKEEFDYYLAIDADISFEPDNIRQLVARDLDIVGGAYRNRCGSGMYTAGDNVPGEEFTEHKYFLSSSCTGLIQVDWIGMGFCLIKRDVFRKARHPWWFEGFIEYKDKTTGELRAKYYGDDMGFAKRVREAGYKIYCDCVVNHHIDYTPELSIKKL